jgi:hypothetical protein
MKNAHLAEADFRWAIYQLDAIESDLSGACIR